MNIITATAIIESGSSLVLSKESSITETAILDLIKSAKVSNASISIPYTLHGEAFAEKCAQEGGRVVTILS